MTLLLLLAALFINDTMAVFVQAAPKQGSSVLKKTEVTTGSAIASQSPQEAEVATGAVIASRSPQEAEVTTGPVIASQAPQQTEETPSPSPTETAPEQTQSPQEEIIPAPSALKGLHSTCQSRRKVLLEWKSSKRAVEYQVYRKTAGGSYQLLGTTSKTRFTDKTIHWGTSYRYKVVPVNEQGQTGKAGTLSCKTGTVVQVKSSKYTYTQMEKDMKGLAALYSDYCTVTSIGKSAKGRQIYDLAVGSPNAKKSLLVVCTLHAREYICSAVAMQQAQYYLQNYNGTIRGTKVSSIFSKIQVHYVMMSNPDGVTIAQTRNSRWKSNANGVDLNRNFPAAHFKVGGTKGREGYSGRYALSEPESKAIAKLTKKLIKKQNLVGNVNYHAMGQIVFGSCSSRKIAKGTKTMYQIARTLTGYSSAAGYQSGTSSSGGQYREYVMYQLGVPSITIEMGRTTAPCTFGDYSNAFQKNKDVVFSIARALR